MYAICVYKGDISMFKRTKKVLSVFVLMITLVCSMNLLVGCKKKNNNSGGGSPAGETPAQVITLTAQMISLEYSTVEFSGSEKTPTVTVKNGETTIASTEYTSTYKDNVAIGTATVTVTAKEGSTVLKGSAEKTFEIKRATLPALADLGYAYFDGNKHEPDIAAALATLHYNDYEVVGWEYKTNQSAEYEALNTQTNNFVNRGYYRVTVRGKGNYQGTQTAVFVICDELPEINPIADAEYTGSSVFDPTSVVVEGLTVGEDYELSYEFKQNGTSEFVQYDDGKDSFTTAGIYKVIATGIEPFGGTKYVTFTVTPKTIGQITLSATESTYNGIAKPFIYEIVGISEYNDYLVSWQFKKHGAENFENYTLSPYPSQNFINAGIYKVIATGHGNYKETSFATFTINKAQPTISVAMPDYIYNAEPEKISVSGTPAGAEISYFYTSDAAVAESTENEGWLPYIIGETKPNAGTNYMYVSISETDNYLSGVSVVDEFVVEKDTLKGLPNLSVQPPIVYDGNSHDPKFVIMSKLSTDLKEGVDYELYWLLDNQAYYPEDDTLPFSRKGEYKVTLAAIGNYKDSEDETDLKQTSFRIIPATMDAFSISRSAYVEGEASTPIVIKSGNTEKGVLTLEADIKFYYNTENVSSGWIEFTDSTVFTAGTYFIKAVASKENYQNKSTEVTYFRVTAAE